jgi:hypothetical protein
MYQDDGTKLSLSLSLVRGLSGVLIVGPRHDATV